MSTQTKTQISIYPTVLLSLGDHIAISTQQHDCKTATGLLFGTQNSILNSISLQNIEYGSIPQQFIKASTRSQFPPSKTLTEVTHTLDSTIYQQVYAQKPLGWYCIDLIRPTMLSKSNQKTFNQLKYLLSLDKSPTLQSSLQSAYTLQQRAQLLLIFSLFFLLQPRFDSITQDFQEYLAILQPNTLSSSSSSSTTPPQVQTLVLFFLPNILEIFDFKQFPQLASSLPFSTGLIPVLQFPTLFATLQQIITHSGPSCTPEQFEFSLQSQFSTIWNYLPSLHQKSDEADQIIASFSVELPLSTLSLNANQSTGSLVPESLISHVSSTSSSGKQTTTVKFFGFDSNGSGSEKGIPSLYTQINHDIIQHSQQYRQQYIQSVQNLRSKLVKLKEILTKAEADSTLSTAIQYRTPLFPASLIQSIKHILIAFSLNPIQSLAYPQLSNLNFESAPQSTQPITSEIDYQNAVQQINQQDVMFDELLLEMSLQINSAALAQTVYR